MGVKAIKLGSWDKHPAYCRIGMSCVAYAQWNKCDGESMRMNYYSINDKVKKATEHCVALALFIMLYKVFLTFKSLMKTQSVTSTFLWSCLLSCKS